MNNTIYKAIYSYKYKIFIKYINIYKNKLNF